MKIDCYLDFTCPWCYIGLHRLNEAFTKYSTVSFEVDFFGYQLRADIAEEGISYRRNLEQMMQDPQAVTANMQRITTIGRELGIHFRFDKDLLVSNTQHAHRLLKFCPSKKKLALVEALYAGVFTDGINLGKIEQLATLGERTGIGTYSAILDFLRSTAQQTEVLADFAKSAEAPIITIPYVVIDHRYPVQAVHLPLVISFCIGGML